MERGPVIVTRAGSAGAALDARLRDAGHDSWWWPAFDLLPPIDPPQVRLRLLDLNNFDLAVFVSPNAVRFTAAALDASWPIGTAIGAVGSTTAEAVLAQIVGARAAHITAPLGSEAHAGSEGFWEAWIAGGNSAQRVMLLRAEQGRDWLERQFVASGVTVESLAVYRRIVHPLNAEQLRLARDAADAQHLPTLIMTSSEAVAALLAQLESNARVRTWVQGGHVFATHPRIASALHTAGFGDVQLAQSTDEALIATLQSALP